MNVKETIYVTIKRDRVRRYTPEQVALAVRDRTGIVHPQDEVSVRVARHGKDVR